VEIHTFEDMKVKNTIILLIAAVLLAAIAFAGAASAEP